MIGAANGITDAVNNVPSGKTISFNIVTTGSIPRFATGGVIPADTTVARLAERGPELFRNPSGSYGMAMDDALYPMTPGARVFTAAQTKRMLRSWNGPAYARGGIVGGSSVNTDLLDIAQKLAMYNGDATPKPIVDVLVKIRELGKAGEITAEQLHRFSDQLKAFNGDNTPRAIVDQALRLDKIATSLQSGTSFPQGLTGVYNDAAKMFGREMGSMGGAILDGWERLTDGYWKSVSTGQIQKGVLAEDGSYVNPSFYKNFKGYTSPATAASQRPLTPTRAAQQGGGTTVIDNSTTTTTVPVQVYPQSTLTPDEGRTLYTNVARAITGITDTVRTSKGARS